MSELDADSFERIYEYAKAYWKKNFNKKGIGEFLIHVKEYFGIKDFVVVDRVWYRINSDVPTIELFGFDSNFINKKIEESNSNFEKKDIIRKEQERVEQYVSELENFLFNLKTDPDRLIPKEIIYEVESYDEYFLDKIKFDDLRKMIQFLMKNGGKYTDYISVANFLEHEFREYLESIINYFHFADDKNEGQENRIKGISSEKIIWKGTKNDLVALYDDLIKLELVMLTKSKDQLLNKHFQILDEKTKKPKELGELKHTRKQLNEGYAKPTEKMEAILKKLNDDKVDDK